MNWTTTSWHQMESRRGSSDRAEYTRNRQERLRNTSKDAGQNSSPTASDINQAETGTRCKEDQSRDGKTTSTHTYNQPEPAKTTTISRATRPGSPRQDGSTKDPVESDHVSSGLKQPTRPTTAVTTTTLTKPTTHEQTTGTTKAHDHDEGGADDDDTQLILSQRIDS